MISIQIKYILIYKDIVNDGMLFNLGLLHEDILIKYFIKKSQVPFNKWGQRGRVGNAHDC